MHGARGMSRAKPSSDAVARTGLSLRRRILRPDALGCAFKKFLPPGAFLGGRLCRVTLGSDEMHRQRCRAHRSNDGARIAVGMTPLTEAVRGIVDTFVKYRDRSIASICCSPPDSVRGGRAKHGPRRMAGAECHFHTCGLASADHPSRPASLAPQDDGTGLLHGQEKRSHAAWREPPSASPIAAQLTSRLR